MIALRFSYSFHDSPLLSLCFLDTFPMLSLWFSMLSLWFPSKETTNPRLKTGLQPGVVTRGCTWGSTPVFARGVSSQPGLHPGCHPGCNAGVWSRGCNPVWPGAMQPRVLPGVAPGVAPGAGAKAALVARRDVVRAVRHVCATFAQLPLKGFSLHLLQRLMYFCAGTHEVKKSRDFLFWGFCLHPGWNPGLCPG